MSARLEVADIFRRHGEAYRQAHDGHLGRVERRTMSAIELCRTAELGGHVEGCRSCGTIRVAYNSCRNRHCPKCQGQACRDWLAARQDELLPVAYFHVVFTLPARDRRRSPSRTRRRSTRSCSRRRPRRCARSPPIPDISAPRSASSRCCTAGARTCTIIRTSIASCRAAASPPDRQRAGSPAGQASSCPCACCRACFAGCFLEELRAAYDAGRLSFFGDLADLAEPAAFAACSPRPVAVEWVVYAKPPFGGPEQVLAYLGRYTHRVAIANSRLISMADDRVAFRWRDYRHRGKTKVMTLDAHEFIRRFLLHTLPDGFHRIRHYGFLANGHRAARLELCRRLLARPQQDDLEPDAESAAVRRRLAAAHRCPCCGEPMITLAIWRCGQAPPSPFWSDTS